MDVERYLAMKDILIREYAFGGSLWKVQARNLPPSLSHQISVICDFMRATNRVTDEKSCFDSLFKIKQRKSLDCFSLTTFVSLDPALCKYCLPIAGRAHVNGESQRRSMIEQELWSKCDLTPRWLIQISFDSKTLGMSSMSAKGRWFTKTGDHYYCHSHDKSAHDDCMKFISVGVWFTNSISKSLRISRRKGFSRMLISIANKHELLQEIQGQSRSGMIDSRNSLPRSKQSEYLPRKRALNNAVSFTPFPSFLCSIIGREDRKVIQNDRITLVVSGKWWKFAILRENSHWIVQFNISGGLYPDWLSAKLTLWDHLAMWVAKSEFFMICEVILSLHIPIQSLFKIAPWKVPHLISWRSRRCLSHAYLCLICFSMNVAPGFPNGHPSASPKCFTEVLHPSASPSASPKCFTQVQAHIVLFWRPCGYQFKSTLSGRWRHPNIEPIHFSQRPKLEIGQNMTISTIYLPILDYRGKYRR
jgi:hypothetical protein